MSAPAGTDTISQISNYLKVQYLNKGLQDFRPKNTPLMTGVPFVGTKEKAGSQLEWPVITSYEHGFTALGQGGDSYASLVSPTSVANRKALVKPYSFCGRTFVDQTSISRASGSEQSFVEILNYKIENLQKSSVLMLEQSLLTGQLGFGVCASGTEADGTHDGITFTDGVFTTGGKSYLKIAKARYAEHFWVGSEGMPIQVWNGNTEVGSNLTIETYSVEGEWIKLGQDIGVANVQGFSIFRKGFKNGAEFNEGPGLFKIMRQANGSGSLFNINSDTTPLWQVNQVDCGAAALSFTKVAQGVAKAEGRGLSESLTLHVHPVTFASLMPDFNTIKDAGTAYKSRIFTDKNQVMSLEHGMASIVFHIGSVMVKIVSNPFIWKGEALGIADGELRRIGSTDLTYDQPSEQGKYWHRLENSTAYELRNFADMALTSYSLNKFIRFHNIVSE